MNLCIKGLMYVCIIIHVCIINIIIHVLFWRQPPQTGHFSSLSCLALSIKKLIPQYLIKTSISLSVAGLVPKQADEMAQEARR